MATLLLERWTACPTGNPADVRAVEFVVEDNDPRTVTNATPRTTYIVRVALRGDVTVLKGKSRDLILTTGRGADRIVAAAARFSATRTGAVVLPPVLPLRWPLTRGWTQAWDVLIGPSRGATLPALNEPVATYLLRTRL